jgi:glycosyltransferase involved in cell wall biosynthesis
MPRKTKKLTLFWHISQRFYQLQNRVERARYNGLRLRDLLKREVSSAFFGHTKYRSAKREVLIAIGEKKADYILFLSHFLHGGSEKVTLNYIQAAKELRPGIKIAVVLAQPSKNCYAKAIPKDVAIIDIGNNAKNLSDKYCALLCGDVIRAMTPSIIQVVNCARAYLWLGKNNKYIKQSGIKVYTNLFHHTILQNGKMWSFAQYHIPVAARSIRKVVTDNVAMIRESVSLYGLPRRKFAVHYQPICNLSFVPPRNLHHKKKLRILWASRINWQKRPDIAVEIAAKLDENKFSMDVYGRFEGNYDKGFFKKKPNIKYCGSFSSFHELPLEQYDIFLYTSQSDGMPNILLEATAAGLPIIAPNQA